MKKKKVAAAVPYEPGLLEDLKDTEFAAEYLTSLINNGDTNLFFSALFEICRAIGVTNVADASNITRDALYKVFDGHQNPRFDTLKNVLNSTGLELAVVPKATSP